MKIESVLRKTISENSSMLKALTKEYESGKVIYRRMRVLKVLTEMINNLPNRCYKKSAEDFDTSEILSANAIESKIKEIRLLQRLAKSIKEIIN